MPRKRTRPVQGNAFSQRISLLRKQEGLTMTALAQRTGVTASYISLLEAGDRQPSRDIVLKLATVFFGAEEQAHTDELLVLAGLSPVSYEMQYQTHDTRFIYEEQLRADPDDFKTFAALTRLLIRKGDYSTAEVRIYDGLKRFHDAARLQALMAQLQVCIHSYAAAVTFQTSALEIYRKAKKPGALKSDPDFADLHTNMGVIYFLWGTQQMEASRQTNGAKQRENLKTEAHKHFEQALNFYRAALAITPEDVYLLDEYARICFNLADLSTGAERDALWQQTIEALITVICFPGVGALGLESVRETNAFLAHAYTKSGQFEMARTLIGVMQSCQPDYWMVYYVKACHFSLRAAAGESDCIALALEALGRAVKVSSPQNNSRSLADADPDLAALREAEPAAFTELLQVPVKAAFQ